MGMMSLLLTAAVAGADQGVKQYVESHVQAGEERPLAGGRGILRRVHNHGLALNRLEQYSKEIRIGSAAAFAGLVIWDLLLQRKKGHILGKLGMSLMLGGAASNTLDRLVRGYVVDYASVRTPSERLTRLTFNLGDVSLLAGSILVLIETGKK